MIIIEPSTIAAYLGAATGTVSFFVTTYNFYNSRPKYKISFPKNSTCLTYSDPLTVKDLFREPTRIFIFTRIENKSSMPVTVTEYTLKIPDTESLFSDSTTKASDRYLVDNTNLHIDVGNFQLLPPLKIESYGAVEGFIFFPYSKIVETDSFNAQLIISTTRGELKSSVKIHNDSKNVPIPTEKITATNKNNK